MNTYAPPYYPGVIESIMHETHDGMMLLYQQIEKAKKLWSQGLDDPVHAKSAILGNIVFSYPGAESKVVVSKGDVEEINKRNLFDKIQYEEFKDMKMSVTEIAEYFLMEDITDVETLGNLLSGGIFDRRIQREANIQIECNKPLGLKRESSVLPFDGLMLCLGSGDPSLEAKAIGLIDSFPRRERSLFNLVMLAEIEWTRMVKAFMEVRQKVMKEKSVLPLQDGKVSGQGIVIVDTVKSSTLVVSPDLVGKGQRGPRLVAVRPCSAFLPYASYIQIMDRDSFLVSGLFDGTLQLKKADYDDTELFLERYTLRHKGFSPFVWHSVCSKRGEWFAYRYSEEHKSLVIIRDIEMEVYRNKEDCLDVDARWLLSIFPPAVPEGAKKDLDHMNEFHELDTIMVTKRNFCAELLERGIEPLNLFEMPIAKVDFSRVDCRTYPTYEKDAEVVKAMCSRNDIFEMPGMIRRVLLLAPKPCVKSVKERELVLSKGYWKCFIPYLDDIRNFSVRRRGYDFRSTPYSDINWVLIEDNLNTESLLDQKFKPKYKTAYGNDMECCLVDEEEIVKDYSSEEYEEYEGECSTVNWSNEALNYDCSECSADDWRMHVNPGHWND